MKKHIPNFITCLNLLCGCVAIYFAVFGESWASYLVFAAALFDLLDGLAARLLKIQSAIGVQLDSLADVVSFGVVPGMIMVSLLEKAKLSSIIDSIHVQAIVGCFPLIIIIFSALRLAKFNVDKRQTSSFIGLPTPANAILIASLLIISNEESSRWNTILKNPSFIIGSTIILSYLLVSEIPMFSLKMKSFSFNENKIQFIFLLSSIVLLIIFFIKAIPLIIILYILLSLLNYLFNKPKLKDEVHSRN